MTTDNMRHAGEAIVNHSDHGSSWNWGGSSGSGDAEVLREYVKRAESGIIVPREVSHGGPCQHFDVYVLDWALAP